VNILGVSFLPEASAAVVCNGTLVSAVSEERLNRIKLWKGVPHASIQKVLELAGLTLDDIDLIATHGAGPSEPDPQPFLAKELEIMRSDLPSLRKKSQVVQLRMRLKHERWVLGSRTPSHLAEIRALGRPVRVFLHHESHAACAYYGSGWDNCFVLTIDGWGEDGSSTLWRGDHGKLVPLSRSYTFDSLGYFYGSVTKCLGFLPHRDEGKVLGLAAHCQDPQSYPLIRSMIDYDPKAMRFVARMDRGLFLPRFENPTLREVLQEFSREDVAAGVQKSLEEVVCGYVGNLGGSIRLAVAGGVFANVKLNQRVSELNNVEEVFVFPNMGDGGLSVGAAWLAYFQETGQRPRPIASVLLGPEPCESEIEEVLSKNSLRYRILPNIEECVASLVADGNVVAWVQGRMEFGPRALGNRSILCQAKDQGVVDWLNGKLCRTDFMPFAPATLAEFAPARYEGLAAGRKAAGYMTMTFNCTSLMKSEAPAAVHVDGTARPQLVSSEDYPQLHSLLSCYYRITGCPSIINTSFNMHEEPIVCTVGDAVRAFRDSQLSYLAVENYLVEGNL